MRRAWQPFPPGGTTDQIARRVQPLLHRCGDDDSAPETLTLTHPFRFSPRTARSPIMVPVPQSHLSGDNVGGPPMTSSPQLRPLGELLGTEALGIDLSRPLDEATFARIGRVFAEHPVLVFRDQNLGAAELAAFGRWFGSPRMHALVKYRHAEYPEVSWLTNVEDDGKVD